MALRYYYAYSFFDSSLYLLVLKKIKYKATRQRGKQHFCSLGLLPHFLEFYSRPSVLLLPSSSVERARLATRLGSCCFIFMQKKEGEIEARNGTGLRGKKVFLLSLI